MKNTVGSALSHSLRPVILLALVAGVAGLLLQQRDSPGSDTDARIAFYQARIGGPGTYPSYARLGLAYLRKARETGESRWFDEAERNLRTSLRYQTNYDALLGMGTALSARHRFAEALRYAQEAAAAANSLEAQGLLFEIHLALGDVEKAAADVERMSAVEQGFATLSRLATLREYRGDSDGALEAIERACEDAQRSSQPANAHAWCEVRRGALHLGARCDVVGAEQAYQRALRVLPNYYFAREHLAELRAAQGNTGEAITLYEGLLRDLPVPAYRLALAEVYEAADRRDDARRERATAQADLLRSVESGSREHVREYILLVAGQKEHAARALRLAEEEWSGRRDWFTADALAWAYYHNGRLPEAAEMADRALRMSTQANGVRLRAAEIFARAGRRGDAERLAAQVLACPAALTPGERPAGEAIQASLAKGGARP